jgi:hypothetical protein
MPLLLQLLLLLLLGLLLLLITAERDRERVRKTLCVRCVQYVSEVLRHAAAAAAACDCCVTFTGAAVFKSTVRLY